MKTQVYLFGLMILGIVLLIIAMLTGIETLGIVSMILIVASITLKVIFNAIKNNPTGDLTRRS